MTPLAELDARLDRFVLRAGDLISLPRVAAEVLELTRDAAVDTASLKLCIEKDPALVAKLLRVVNSSLFGLCREVADLNQALGLLGTKPLKLLVLGFSLPDALFRNVAEDFLSRYWRQTLSTAVAARELCSVLKLPCGDEAFIAALLKHLGLLVLVQQVGPSYVRFVERTQGGSLPLVDAERMALGFDHTQLTSRLLTHWQLPQAIVDIASAGASSDELPAPTRRLAQLLLAAEALSHWLTDHEEASLAEAHRALTQVAQISDAQLGAVLVCLREKVRQLADVLSLDLRDEQTSEQLSAAAYRQLAAAAREAAGEMLDGACARGDIDASRAALLALDETQRLQRLVEAATRVEADCTDIEAERLGEIATASPRLGATPSGGAWPSEGCSAVLAAKPLIADGTLIAQVAEEMARCRRARRPLTLALVEVEGFERLPATSESAQAAIALERLRRACAMLEIDRVMCLDAGQGKLAVLLPDCERQEAVRLIRPLLRFGGRMAEAPSAAGRDAVGVSIGLAAIEQVPRNFPPEELWAAARRCLSGARASGGNCVKSIDV